MADDSQRRGAGLDPRVIKIVEKIMTDPGPNGFKAFCRPRANTTGYGKVAAGRLGSQQDPDNSAKATGAGTGRKGMGTGTTPGSSTMGYGRGTGTARYGTGAGPRVGSNSGMGTGTDPYGTTAIGTEMGTDPYATTGTGTGTGSDPYAATDQPGMMQQQGTGGYGRGSSGHEGSLLEKAKETLSSVTGGRRE